VAYAWPSGIRPSQARIFLATSSLIIPAQRNSFAAVVYELPDAGWVAELTFGPLTPRLKRQLRGFVDRLRGPAGTALLPDWDYDYDSAAAPAGRGLRGGASGAVVATGAKDSATVDLTNVVNVNPAGAFLAGDRIGIGGYVYEVCADAPGFNGAVAGLEIAPRLRAAASSSPVLLSGLTFQMRLKDDQQGAFDLTPAGNASVGLSFVEALP
jgi:hypothetical protein